MSQKVLKIVYNKELTEKERLKAMRAVSDEELQSTLFVVGYGRNPEQWIPVKGAAQAEIDRRSQEAVKKLAMKTTRWSVGVGGVVALIAAVVGAVVGACLSK